MDDYERYLKFMEDETALSQVELYTASKVEEITKLVAMTTESHGDGVHSMQEVKDYIEKNATVLLNYAPHLTLQIYLGCFASLGEQINIISSLEAFLNREDVPAKAYSVINSYISVLKKTETAAPSTSFASDEKIAEEIDKLNPSNIQTLQVMLMTRLQMGASIDHFIEMVSPFMNNTKKPVYSKWALCILLYNLSRTYDTEKQISIKVVDALTNPIDLIVDLSVKEDVREGSFIKTCSYFVKKLNLTSAIASNIEFYLLVYRLTHKDADDEFDSGDKFRKFVVGLLEGGLGSISLDYDKLELGSDFRGDKHYIQGYSFIRYSEA